jgi:hypothetical protein
MLWASSRGLSYMLVSWGSDGEFICVRAFMVMSGS